MASSPQLLSDLEEIKVLKHHYFRGVDTANGDMLAGLFTDDVTGSFNGGSYKVSLTGRAHQVKPSERQFTLTSTQETDNGWKISSIRYDRVVEILSKVQRQAVGCQVAFSRGMSGESRMSALT